MIIIIIRRRRRRRRRSKKSKAIPVTGREGLYCCETLRVPHYLDKNNNNNNNNNTFSASF
jgi:hypothetical protein